MEKNSAKIIIPAKLSYLPCGINGYDALILQYLNNVNIDAGRINLFAEDGREILEYIKSVRE